MRSFPRFLALPLLAASGIAAAVVIRHDVDDTKYHAAEGAFPALADVPAEGHGVLIAPQWVVTAAHVVCWQHEPIGEVTIDGKARAVEKLVVHPGYEALPPIPERGDVAPFMKLMFERDDIALIKLAEPVTDVAPAPLYRGHDELGKVVTFFGKGATGEGRTGYTIHAPHRTRLRQGYNEVSDVRDRWIGSVFDSGEVALPLEAKTGSGDSGGPFLIEQDGQWQLAGLAALDYAEGDIADFKQGIYGMKSYQVRISAYADWIDSVQRDDAAAKSKATE